MFILSLKKIRDTFFGVILDDRGRIWATASSERGREKIVESLLGSLPTNSAFKEERNEYVDKILDGLKSLREGEKSSVKYELALDAVPNFYRKVYESLQKVPRGKVISYGELAKASGVDGAARAVGNAMRNNRFAPIVPCHRVIKSDGSLGGFGGGVGLKRRILLKEGVLFKKEKIDKSSLLSSGELRG